MECEWVDCSRDEEDMYPGQACWKDLCHGCDSMTCQLWFETRDDWKMESCMDSGYFVEAEKSAEFAKAERLARVAGEFHDTAHVGMDMVCANFSCIEALGAIVGGIAA